MCGIAGIISKSRTIDFNGALSRMLSVLRHRGPDHTDTRVLDEMAYMGFNRLSIVDLSQKGNQPLFNEDNTLALVLNGEIYNYKALREELISFGHVFSSNTDSETVLHAYEEWGRECLRRLRGMFALAVWDSGNSELFLARDRLGIKPLYYLEHKKTLIFASELKAFTVLPKEFWNTRLDENTLDLYFRFPFINDNINTLIRGVKKLPPGHLAAFKDGHLAVKRYWNLEKKIFPKLSFELAKEETERILREAIEGHLIGDVPIALMLTGGLDSSVIAALTLQCNKRLEFAITAGHPNFTLDERKFGKLAAGYLGIKHIELEVDPCEVAQTMEKIVWFFDDLSSIGFFYQIFMAKKVRDLGIKAVLLGQGSDEIFGGYHIFKMSTLPFSILPSAAWNMLYFKILSGRKFGRDYFRFSRLIRKGAFRPGEDMHNICSRFEIENQLPNYNLAADDKGYMAYSVEARTPYLDHKVVEWVYSLPQSYKLKGLCFSRGHKMIKYILREIGSKYLPEQIFNRRKQGVGLSMLDVIRQDRAKVRDYLLAENSVVGTLFDRKSISSAIEDEENNIFFLARLYIFELWGRQYLSEKSGSFPHTERE